MATIDSIMYVLFGYKVQLTHIIEDNKMGDDAVETLLEYIKTDIKNKELFQSLIEFVRYLIEIKNLLIQLKKLYPRIRVVIDDLLNEINYIILYSEINDFEELIKYKSTTRFHPDDIDDVDILDYIVALNIIENELELTSSRHKKELVTKIIDLIDFGLTLHIKKINKFIEHYHNRKPLDENIMDQLRYIKRQIIYMKYLPTPIKASLYSKIDRLLEYNRNLQHKKHKSKWSFWNRNGGKKYTRKNRK
jgi:hypothetical protein